MKYDAILTVQEKFRKVISGVFFHKFREIYETFKQGNFVAHTLVHYSHLYSPVHGRYVENNTLHAAKTET